MTNNGLIKADATKFDDETKLKLDKLCDYYKDIHFNNIFGMTGSLLEKIVK